MFSCCCNDNGELENLEIISYPELEPILVRKQSLLRKPRHTKVYEVEKAEDRDDESTSDDTKSLLIAKTSVAVQKKKAVTFHPSTRIKKKKAVKVVEEKKEEDVISNLSDNSSNS